MLRVPIPSFPFTRGFCYKRCDPIFWNLCPYDVEFAVRGEGAMKRPEEVTLSREEGEALLARLEATALTAEDRRVLGKVLTFYLGLQELVWVN